MIAYSTDFASLYDTFYADKPYDAEVAFVGRLLRENGVEPPGRLLDVACGTGQHAVRFADSGWTVVGVDRSPAMLDVANRRAGHRSISFLQQDMAGIRIDGQPFDAATCLFDSIGYAITNERIQSTLVGIRRHLRPGGLLAVEFWHAAAMLTSYDDRREREWSTEGGTIGRTSETSLDVTRSIARVAYRVERRDRTGSVLSTSVEVHENRFFLQQEMAFLLESAGFKPIRFVAGYNDSAAIDLDTWHILSLARSTAEPIG